MLEFRNDFEWSFWRECFMAAMQEHQIYTSIVFADEAVEAYRKRDTGAVTDA